MNSKMLYCGIDISAETFDICMQTIDVNFDWHQLLITQQGLSNNNLAGNVLGLAEVGDFEILSKKNNQLIIIITFP